MSEPLRRAGGRGDTVAMRLIVRRTQAVGKTAVVYLCVAARAVWAHPGGPEFEA